MSGPLTSIEIAAIEKDRLKLQQALHIIMGTDCGNFTSGLGSCFEEGRVPGHMYGAFSVCASCIAYEALGGKVKRKARG